jgi:GTP 3',8-cyclase
MARNDSTSPFPVLRPLRRGLAQLLTRATPSITRVLSRMEGGFIVPPTHLELIVADHCNIACRSCNHASPIMNRWFADPEVVRRDFSILARIYRPRFVKVLGGEPLLHKSLAAVIQAARSTGISGHFLLVTNGTLLTRMSDAVWDAIDELEVSCYPGAEPPGETLSQAREKARQSQVKLKLTRYEHFRDTISAVGTQNRVLVEQIYSTCKIANVWGCHAVREGAFFKCPQSIYIPRITGQPFEADHIRIEDTPDLQARLLAFVNSRTALRSCTYCLGTAGKKNPHTLLPRREWQADLHRPTEEMVDYEWLKRAQVRQELLDDCKIVTDDAGDSFRPQPS